MADQSRVEETRRLAEDLVALQQRALETMRSCEQARDEWWSGGKNFVVNHLAADGQPEVIFTLDRREDPPLRLGVLAAEVIHGCRLVAAHVELLKRRSLAMPTPWPPQGHMPEIVAAIDNHVKHQALPLLFAGVISAEAIVMEKATGTVVRQLSATGVNARTAEHDVIAVVEDFPMELRRPDLVTALISRVGVALGPGVNTSSGKSLQGLELFATLTDALSDVDRLVEPFRTWLAATPPSAASG